MSDFRVDWAALLVDAVNQPGVVSAAYSRFWNYSVGNQLLAQFQCALRKLEPGPINTFAGWLELDRHVKRGERALTLCMPVTVKSKPALSTESPVVLDGAVDKPDAAPAPITRFVYRPRWFVLSQTEGKEYLPTELPAWSEALALSNLSIERCAFQHLNGNAQGYATGRQVAVSPLAALPHKTLFHELAHVLLGHCAELSRMDDDEKTPVNLREVEAECVALICCESLGMPGTECCRGYIQHWLGQQTIQDRNAQRIFRAADQLLKAGRATLDHSDPV